MSLSLRFFSPEFLAFTQVFFLRVSCFHSVFSQEYLAFAQVLSRRDQLGLRPKKEGKGKGKGKGRGRGKGKATTAPEKTPQSRKTPASKTPALKKPAAAPSRRSKKKTSDEPETDGAKESDSPDIKDTPIPEATTTARRSKRTSNASSSSTGDKSTGKKAKVDQKNPEKDKAAKNGDQEGDTPLKSFARRPRPGSNATAIQKWDSIRNAFNEDIRHSVTKASAHEDVFVFKKSCSLLRCGEAFKLIDTTYYIFGVSQFKGKFLT